ncbi:MAG TPA: D-glycero-D-manno-heptose 1-phosphate guanosyltransferase [Saprospiraceae bacterium]|nr:D-glycero-D-manno-heptose 1-phosphate guanosyltransferase [Saprospiraceae bacterium]
MTNKAIILAGGLGTRLQSVVKELPKPMAPVQGKPFLEFVFQYLIAQGIEEAILSIGYRAEAIRAYFGDQYRSCQLKYVIEAEPLGTGGAIKKAAELCGEETFFVLNGDTIFDANLKALETIFLQQKADVALSLKAMRNFDRYGLVEIDGDFRIRAFQEKQYCEAGLINGGIYLMKKSVFDLAVFPQKFSFEKDFLETYLDQLKIIGCPLDGYFIDIGIPEDYERAQRELIVE